MDRRGYRIGHACIGGDDTEVPPSRNNIQELVCFFLSTPFVVIRNLGDEIYDERTRIKVFC
jgi:hypothetical protein